MDEVVASERARPWVVASKVALGLVVIVFWWFLFVAAIWLTRGLAVPLLLTAAGLYLWRRPLRSWGRTDRIMGRVWVAVMALFVIGPFIHEQVRLLLFMGLTAMWFLVFPVSSDELGAIP